MMKYLKILAECIFDKEEKMSRIEELKLDLDCKQRGLTLKQLDSMSLKDIERYHKNKNN